MDVNISIFIEQVCPKIPIIDLRPSVDFQTIRLASIFDTATSEAILPVADGLTIINIPFADLGHRCIEFPPRNVLFDVIYPNEEIAKDTYFEETVRRSSGTAQKPWNVRNSVIGSRIFFEEVRKKELSSPNIAKIIENGKAPLRSGRLWQPDTMVESLLLPLLLDLSERTSISRPSSSSSTTTTTAATTTTTTTTTTTIAATSQPPPTNTVSPSLLSGNVKVMDLGSGAGRDVCFLAEELIHNILKKGLPRGSISGDSSCDCASGRFDIPLSIVAVDFHKNASNRCIPLWQSRGVSHVVNLERVDLKKAKDFDTLMLKYGGSVDLIYAVRFLNRGLLERIANGSYISPGGYFAISHFITEPDGSFPFEHPTIHDVLTICELDRIFAINGDDSLADNRRKAEHETHVDKSSDRFTTSQNSPFLPTTENSAIKWRIIRNEIVKDNDFGRSLIQFCVQRL